MNTIYSTFIHFLFKFLFFVLLLIQFRYNRGTSGIDIDLRRVDIDQCPQKYVIGLTQPLNIFAGTDKCKQRTTEVSNTIILV